MQRVAQGNKGTESTKAKGKHRKRVALLALPACQEDETRVALKQPERKGSFKISLVKWFQELSFLIIFDLY